MLTSNTTGAYPVSRSSRRCGPGVRSRWSRRPSKSSTDPAGNVVLSGASEALRQILIERLQDDYFTSKRRNESARAAIFTRKVGHTQRGGPPILFDRFYAAQLGGQPPAP